MIEISYFNRDFWLFLRKISYLCVFFYWIKWFVCFEEVENLFEIKFGVPFGIKWRLASFNASLNNPFILIHNGDDTNDGNALTKIISIKIIISKNYKNTTENTFFYIKMINCWKYYHFFGNQRKKRKIMKRKMFWRHLKTRNLVN